MGISKKTRSGITLFAGIVFGLGWWLWFDAHIFAATHQEENKKIQFTYYIPGIVSTLALFLLLIVDFNSLNPMSWYFDESLEAKVKVWLFICFTLMFASIGAAIWIMAAVFLPPHSNGKEQWPGIAILIQTVLILVSSILFVFPRTVSHTDDYTSMDE